MLPRVTMVKRFPQLPCWRIVILLLACWPLRGGCSWLTKGGPAKSKDGDLIGLVSSGWSDCSVKQAKCWCGSDEDRHVTVINIKQCPVPTSWKTLCEPCQKPEDSCAQLQHCARCMPHNPSAICAQCPLDRHGLHCELEQPCKTPNVSEHMDIRPRYTKRGVYKLSFRCLHGRELLGPRHIRCKNDTATWNKDPPTCVFPARCTDQPNATIPFTHVNHRQSGHVVLECAEGYVTSGKILQTTLQCEHGAWVNITERVKCERSVCPRLSVEDGNEHEEIINASLPGFASPGSRVQVTCQKGFTLQGPAEVHCSSGRWQPSVPRCVAQKCEVVQHGTKCSLNTTAGNTVFLSSDTEIYPGQIVPIGCKEGLFRKRGVGKAERICLFNGTLTAPDIDCKKAHVCVINAPDDSHLRFCRKSWGSPCIPGKDNYSDKTYEFPDNVAPARMRVYFDCDNEFYQLDPSVTMQTCNLNEQFITPTCKAVCGVRHPPKDPYIAGGAESDIEVWPWQAGLVNAREGGLFVCGATLIYERWALTAGHCVTNESNPNKLMDKDDLRLVYGKSLTENVMNSAIRDKEFQGQFGVSSIILHHHFNKDTLDHDIALIELKTPVEFNYRVGVACLPATQDCSDQRLVKGTKGVVTGWGASDSDGLSERLHELTLYVANTTECEKLLKDRGYNKAAWTENMFCAESNSTTEDTTNGDSGGPFVVQGGTKEWVLEGIVSWGLPKNEIDINIEQRKHHNLTNKDPFAANCPGRVCYSAYTRVAKYLDWIQEKTGRSTGKRCA